MSGTLLCYGYGYTARALARGLLADGWRVAGTCRDDSAAAGMTAEGVTPVAFGEAAPDGADHILVSTPPGDGGDPVLAVHGDAIAEATPKWIGYLSTTGVYGDTGGRVVDETAPAAPSNARGRRRVAAETAWLAANPATHVFRLAGIYGPGRSPLDNVRAGRARRVDKPGFAFSRVHVDDIVEVLRASMIKPRPGAVYNVADDEPAPQADVVTYACELLGVAPPPLVPFAEAAREMSDMARSFWTDNRRIDNARIKRELGVRLRYPSYQEGLRAILTVN